MAFVMLATLCPEALPSDLRVTWKPYGVCKATSRKGYVPGVELALPQGRLMAAAEHGQLRLTSGLIL